jgi:hypothetical protein
VEGENRQSEKNPNDLIHDPRRGLLASDAIGVGSLPEDGFPTPFPGLVRLHASPQAANVSNQLAVRFRSSEPPQPRVPQARRHPFRLAVS